MALKPTVGGSRKAATPGNISGLRLGKKMVLYGAPAVGKTTCIVGLVKAGWDVVYVDTDGNPEPLLDLTPLEQARVTYIPLRNNSSRPSRHQALITLSDTGKLTWCPTHGLHLCPECATSEQLEWDSKGVDWSKTIFVLDSYTAVHAACTAKAYEAHKLDDEAKLEIPHFGTVTRLNVRSIDWALNSSANVVIITHRGNKRGITEKGADKYYPMLGSQNLSGSLPYLVNALWYVNNFASPVVATKPLDGAVEAFTRGGADAYAKLKPSDAVVAYFGKPKQP